MPTVSTKIVLPFRSARLVPVDADLHSAATEVLSTVPVALGNLDQTAGIRRPAVSARLLSSWDGHPRARRLRRNVRNTAILGIPILIETEAEADIEALRATNPEQLADFSE